MMAGRQAWLLLLLFVTHMLAQPSIAAAAQ
jgi:hypothetical protein